MESESYGFTFDRHGNPTKEVSIQHLEEHINSTWGFVEDVELIIEFVRNNSADREYQEQLLSMLKGVKELHNLRFEKLFRTYEQYLHQEFVKKQDQKMKEYYDLDDGVHYV